MWRKRGQIICLQGNNKSMVIFVLKRLFNVKYLPLFHHFKAIYQFPKHIIFLVKIVANAALIYIYITENNHIFPEHEYSYTYMYNFGIFIKFNSVRFRFSDFKV